MQVPVQITIRDIDHSPAVEQHIRDRANKLNQYCNQIIACHVVVEFAQKNQNTGKMYNVRVFVSMPRHIELAVTHKLSDNLYLAIHEAFDCMVRKIEDAVGKLKGDVKNHPIPLNGHIARLFDYGDFGFIECADGSEYYFNADNLSYNNFNSLQVGDAVEFIEKIGSDGPQAHRIRILKESQKVA